MSEQSPSGRSRQWLDRPVRIELPGQARSVAVPTSISVPTSLWQRPARFLAVAIPVSMMVIGILLALLAADRAEQPDTEGTGTLGVELGAALWFAGAVTLGARHAPTLLRIVVLVGTALAGIALIGVALVRDWTGAGLSLAMEFGVGALAVSVIDVVLLGMLHGGITHVADGPDDGLLTFDLAKSWHLVDVRLDRGTRAEGRTGEG